jgi:hypothetical protein
LRKFLSILSRVTKHFYYVLTDTHARKSGLVIKDVDDKIETDCLLPEKYKSKGSKIHIQILNIHNKRMITKGPVKGYRLHYKMTNHSLQRYTTHTTKARRSLLGMLVK